MANLPQGQPFPSNNGFTQPQQNMTFAQQPFYPSAANYFNGANVQPTQQQSFQNSPHVFTPSNVQLDPNYGNQTSFYPSIQTTAAANYNAASTLNPPQQPTYYQQQQPTHYQQPAQAFAQVTPQQANQQGSFYDFTSMGQALWKLSNETIAKLKGLPIEAVALGRTKIIQPLPVNLNFWTEHDPSNADPIWQHSHMKDVAVQPPQYSNVEQPQLPHTGFVPVVSSASPSKTTTPPTAYEASQVPFVSQISTPASLPFVANTSTQTRYMVSEESDLSRSILCSTDGRTNPYRNGGVELDAHGRPLNGTNTPAAQSATSLSKAAAFEPIATPTVSDNNAVQNIAPRAPLQQSVASTTVSQTNRVPAIPLATPTSSLSNSATSNTHPLHTPHPKPAIFSAPSQPNVLAAPALPTATPDPSLPIPPVSITPLVNLSQSQAVASASTPAVATVSPTPSLIKTTPTPQPTIATPAVRTPIATPTPPHVPSTPSTTPSQQAQRLAQEEKQKSEEFTKSSTNSTTVPAKLPSNNSSKGSWRRTAADAQPSSSNLASVQTSTYEAAIGHLPASRNANPSKPPSGGLKKLSLMFEESMNEGQAILETKKAEKLYEGKNFEEAAALIESVISTGNAPTRAYILKAKIEFDTAALEKKMPQNALNTLDFIIADLKNRKYSTSIVDKALKFDAELDLNESHALREKILEYQAKAKIQNEQNPMEKAGSRSGSASSK